MEVFDASLWVEDYTPKSDKPVLYGADNKQATLVDEDNNVVPVKVLGVGQGYYSPETGEWMLLHYKVGDVLIIEDSQIHKTKYKGKDYWRINAASVLFRESKGGLV